MESNLINLEEKILPIDQNPAAVYISSLSEGSKRSQFEALKKIALFISNGEISDVLAIPWHLIRYQHAQAIRAGLINKGLSYKTINRHLTALRRVLLEASRLGLMSSEDYHRAADVPNVKGETLPAGRHITAGEIKALFNVCINDNSPSGYRDAAILGLLAGCGLRRAEVVVLDLADYDELTGQLKITGKRNKQRLAYLTNGAADALNDWLAIRGKGEGALFMAINKGGKIQPGRLTDQSVYDMLLRRAIQAGIESLSPHDLRRTFIGELLDAGADIATVSFLAGHQDVNTTAKYDRRPEQAKRKAAELLHVPYIKRLGLNK